MLTTSTVSFESMRMQYGESYVSVVPNGTYPEIPWKPLPIIRFQHFQDLLAREVYPEEFIQDLIFKECVTSEWWLKNYHDTPAGIVSQVVLSIMAASGPISTAQVNRALDMARLKSARNLLCEMAQVITTAMPAYTLEQIEAMVWDRLCYVYAICERKLIEAGLLKEHLVIPEDSKTESSAEDHNPQVAPDQNQENNSDGRPLTSYEEFVSQLKMDPNKRAVVHTSRQLSADESGFSVESFIAMYPELAAKMANGEKLNPADLAKDKRVKKTKEEMSAEMAKKAVISQVISESFRKKETELRENGKVVFVRDGAPRRRHRIASTEVPSWNDETQTPLPNS